MSIQMMIKLIMQIHQQKKKMLLLTVSVLHKGTSGQRFITFHNSYFVTVKKNKKKHTQTSLVVPSLFYYNASQK